MRDVDSILRAGFCYSSAWLTLAAWQEWMFAPKTFSREGPAALALVTVQGDWTSRAPFQPKLLKVGSPCKSFTGGWKAIPSFPASDCDVYVAVPLSYFISHRVQDNKSRYLSVTRKNWRHGRASFVVTVAQSQGPWKGHCEGKQD